MADNSLDSLLEWMKTGDPLRGWGMIFALGRDTASRLLLQEYIARIGSEAELPVTTADIPGFGDTRRERISHFQLGPPRLSFENSRLSTTQAMLTLPVTGGSHLSWQKKPGSSWLMTRMALHDPLQGPSLVLQLPFAAEPTSVADDARVYLNLSSGTDYRLTFADSAEGQALGGAFFEGLLKSLGSAQLEYPIGHFRAGEGSPLMPEHFRLAAQAADGAEDGALLTLVQFEGTAPGSMPGADDYHYLIPDSEGVEYPATVLFDRATGPVLPGGEVLLDRLTRLLGGDESNFTIEREGGELIRATATGGMLSIAPSITRLVPLKVEGEWVQATAHSPAVNIAAVGPTPMTLARVGEGKYSLRWVSTEQTANVVIKFDQGYPDTQKPAPHKIDLQALFEHVEQADGSLVFEATTFIARGSPLPGIPLHEQHRPGGIAAITPYVLLSLAHYATARINAVVRSALNLQADSRSPADDLLDSANELIRGVIELNAGKEFTADVVKFPRDVACFGGVGQRPATFAIAPLELRLLAGARHTFTTLPAVEGLTWAVTNAGPQSEPAGEMDARSGEYTAPGAAEITGHSTRVRVTATAGAASCSALVSVVVEALTVSPLFTQCAHDSEPVLLRAGQLQQGTLEWAIKNPDPAQSGTLVDHQDGTCSYQPHPFINGVYFVVDEVAVSDSATGAEQTSVVLVEHTPKVQIGVSTVQAGTVYLSALFNDTSLPGPRWSIELGGPGEIKSNGQYIPNTAAPDRFVLIKLRIVYAETEQFIHYVALPLPLSNFTPSNQPAQVTP